MTPESVATGRGDRPTKTGSPQGIAPRASPRGRRRERLQRTPGGRPQAYNPAMNPPLDYTALNALLARLGYGGDASAFHGSLCGALSRQRPEEVDPLALFDDEDLAPDLAARADLQRLRDDTIASLTDLQSAFMPMLPSDEASLAERARALGGWCEGFLYGMAGRIKLDLRACSDEVREIVKDFSQFTRAALDPSVDDEVEEDAYAELVEYIRVGAQLVYMELHPRNGATSDSPTIH